MIFYKVRIKTLPTIETAGTEATDSYSKRVVAKSHTLEVFLHSGEIERVEGDKAHLQSANSVSIVMPDMDVDSRASTKNTIYITSAQANMDFDFERVESEDIETCRKILCESQDILCLPYSLALGAEYVAMEKALRQISLYYPRETAASGMKAASIFIDVLACVDEIFRASVLGGKNDSVLLYYSQKAKKYIKAHYNEKVQIKGIANELGISPNYLSNIFKQETGQTVSEYIAHVRLEKARELLRNKRLSIDEVAKSVGVGSARYLNEMFKKHYGSSIHKTMLVDRGVSLYSDETVDTDDIDA